MRRTKEKTPTLGRMRAVGTQGSKVKKEQERGEQDVRPLVSALLVEGAWYGNLVKAAGQLTEPERAALERLVREARDARREAEAERDLREDFSTPMHRPLPAGVRTSAL